LYISAAFGLSCLASEALYRIVEKPIMNARNNFPVSQHRRAAVTKTN
jgi:peptidoglycan/LPS O-acetylase OafA/YrhL